MKRIIAKTLRYILILCLMFGPVPYMIIKSIILNPFNFLSLILALVPFILLIGLPVLIVIWEEKQDQRLFRRRY